VGIELVRFKASDGLELQGWLSDEPGPAALIHIHGMSSTGYEDRFIDYLRDLYVQIGVSFFSIDTRGRGIVSDFRQEGSFKRGGSAFEIFGESVHDIQGALDYIRSLNKTTVILEGHSLGASKLVNYLVQKPHEPIAGAILLAPTDMVGWANGQAGHGDYLKKAKDLIAQGKGSEFVDTLAWINKTPLSAQTYPTISEAGTEVDIYGDREGGPLLGRIGQPALIVYGDNDIGITFIDGSIDKWLARVETIKNPRTTISVIPGATHTFDGLENELAAVTQAFVKELVGSSGNPRRSTS
jgi:alpha-beta hydrolase superfamily lysophospholipase